MHNRLPVISSDRDNLELTRARLALLHALTIVIASGLHIFGVKPMTEMH
jgi:arginyl-tRNA synthetase